MLNEIQALRALANVDKVTIKRETTINGIPGTVEMSFDKSTLDLIVAEVVKKLKSEQADK